MAHYAFLDENNVVIEVITGRDENEIIDGISDWEKWYGDFRGKVCKRYSYNTFGGVHSQGGIPFRKNGAGIGYYYDETRDAFIAPKPHNSWILNEETCIWEAPIPYPSDGKFYTWNEISQSWIEVTT